MLVWLIDSGLLLVDVPEFFSNIADALYESNAYKGTVLYNYSSVCERDYKACIQYVS